jgi:hypothetical protein
MQQRRVVQVLIEARSVPSDRASRHSKTGAT